MSNESKADFIDGQRDYQEGLPADPERNEAYQRGFAAEYQWQEIKSKQAELSWD